MSEYPLSDPARLLADLDFVRRLARRLCDDRADAEDVVQEAMLSALHDPDERVRSPRPWLAAVVRNLVHNLRRGDRRRRAREQLRAGEQTAPSAADVAAREQVRAVVVAEVMKLPEPFRAAVLLRYYEGLDTRQCAARLGVPIATVRTRLVRGVARLRAALDTRHGGDRQQWRSALAPLAWHGRGAFAAGAAWVGALLLLGTITFIASRSRPVAGAVEAPPMSVTTAVRASGAPVGGDDRHQAPAAAMRREPAATPVRQLTGSVVAGDTDVGVANALVLASAFVDGGDPDATIPLGIVRTDAAGDFVLALSALEELPASVIARTILLFDVDADERRPGRFDCTMGEVSADGALPRSFGLGAAALTKGWVRDAAGRPVPGAHVLVLSGHGDVRYSIEDSGMFALPLRRARDDDSAFDCTLLACSSAHGFSRPRRVHVDPTRETRVPDLIVDEPLGTLLGRVVDRNGRGVPDVGVEFVCLDGSASFAVGGVVVESFGQRMSRQFSRTDAEGRFVHRALRHGQYVVQALGQLHEVEITWQPANLTLIAETARIALRVLDRHGFAVAVDREGIYSWCGAAAEQARRRFANEGLSASLVATSERQGHRALEELEPPVFAVAEVAWRSCGPKLASCWLGPGDYYGELVVPIEVPDETGAARVDVRWQDGSRPGRVVVRAGRAPGPHAVPVPLADPIGNDGVTEHFLGGSVLRGHWRNLPDDGLLTGLPLGELTIEVLADPVVERGEVIGARSRPASQAMTIRAGEVVPAAFGMARACHPTLVLRLPETVPIGATSWHPTASFRPVGGGEEITVALRREGSEAWSIHNTDGLCRVCSPEAVPAGRYALRVAAQFVVPGGGNDPRAKVVSIAVDAAARLEVEVAPSMSPVEVPLVAW